MRQGISCIIPAHNEAPRIGAVLSSVIDHPLIDEVIVVDDGSSDGTAAVVRRFERVRLIVLAKNGGKSAAVAAGLNAARFEHLLLLDSDLVGLTRSALTQLIRPVLRGQADVSISLRRNAPWLWKMIGIDYISGERVLPRRLLGTGAELMSLPGFGMEVAMNAHWIAEGARIAIVRWPDVQSPLKSAKQGLWAGLKADLLMLRDIFATVPLPVIIQQIWRMRFMAVKPSARGTARMRKSLKPGAERSHE
ncbi:glycosyltransferase [Martelella alba]|uniref:Glycosyltransferase n=1 Tax=Martelella alba TaxID=2590451 RepID=A0A506UA76_9HYPH|nr:glycosyltransferase [Martelella alba]TPW30011.1 glycosyltransferase [Martelella alba]